MAELAASRSESCGGGASAASSGGVAPAAPAAAPAARRAPHRLLYFAVAFVLLLFFGLIYAWSLFVEPLETEFGWQRSETSVIFTLSIITFCVGMLAAGVLEQRFSPRVLLLATAACIGIGFVASTFAETLPHIYLTYGVLVGAGVGLGADCVISATLKWFPDRQGVANGAMLMGFGMGTMVLSPAVTAMLGALGWRMTLGVLGVAFAFIVAAGALIMRLPDDEYVKPLLAKAHAADIVSAVDMNARQMMRTPSFWTFMLWLMLVTCGGLALISQAVPAAMELLGSASGGSADAASDAALLMATAAMGSVSAFNGLGRLLNGFIWDKLGYRVSLLWVSVAFAVGMLCCAIAMSVGSFPLLVVGFVLLGLMYGGNMCAMSTMVSTFFGTRYFGINYAIATCQMIPAAVIGPQILAAAQMGSGSYLQAFWVFFGIAIAALAVSFAIRRPKESMNRA